MKNINVERIIADIMESEMKSVKKMLKRHQTELIAELLADRYREMHPDSLVEIWQETRAA